MSTLTLRPNAAGDATTLFKKSGTYNWQMVDEASPDNDGSYVYVVAPVDGSNTKYDLYNLPDHTTETGTINYVRVYFRCRRIFNAASGNAWAKIKTGGTEYIGSSKSLGMSYSNYYHQWNTNPKTGVAWTWGDIDALQAGIQLRAYHGTDCVTGHSRCTQVYVAVNYTTVTAPTVTTQAADGIGID